MWVTDYGLWIGNVCSALRVLYFFNVYQLQDKNPEPLITNLVHNLENPVRLDVHSIELICIITVGVLGNRCGVLYLKLRL